MQKAASVLSTRLLTDVPQGEKLDKLLSAILLYILLFPGFLVRIQLYYYPWCCYSLIGFGFTHWLEGNPTYSFCFSV